MNPTSAIMIHDITTPKAWKDKKTALKAQYPNLTEEDLQYTGDFDRLIRNIQGKIGKSRAEVKQLVKRL